MIWKRDEQPDSSAPVGLTGASPEVTIIGAGAHLEGTIVSAGSLRVDGKVKGTIQADGDIMLTADADVEATIQAHNVSISGRLTGDIHAKGAAEIAKGGSVDGNVTSATLVIQEGATFNGTSSMRTADAVPPTSQAAPTAPATQAAQAAGEPEQDDAEASDEDADPDA